MKEYNIKCLNCEKENFQDILNLGDQPWCGNFLKKEDVGKEPYYPLKLIYCNNCELLQLSYRVPKEIMFKNHQYLSGTTKTLTDHFFEIAKENIKQYKLTKKDCVLDIGGNDGTQLLQYKKQGISNIINVESADNISKISENNGVKTYNDFFNMKFCKNHLRPSSIKLINASGVFFHLEELRDVINAIEYLLEDDGIFTVQFMYAGSMIDNMNFDTIYHEHLCYYTINSFLNLFKNTTLKLNNIYFSTIHSGTIIAKMVKNKTTELTQKEQEFIILDKTKYSLENIQLFAESVVNKKSQLKNFLLKLKSQKKVIYACGAPAKGNTLLNYFDIDTSLISKTVEINDMKIGRFLPGSHIPIVKENKMDVPDYYLLLSHNFLNEIVNKNKHLKVKYIIPFPEVRVIQ
jgi:hypothetical protein